MLVATKQELASKMGETDEKDVEHGKRTMRRQFKSMEDEIQRLQKEKDAAGGQKKAEASTKVSEMGTGNLRIK